MSYNISDPLPKKSDNTSEKVRKISGDLDDIKKAFVTTIDTVVKKGTTDTFDREEKTYVVKKAITSPTSEKKKIETVNKTEK